MTEAPLLSRPTPGSSPFSFLGDGWARPEAVSAPRWLLSRDGRGVLRRGKTGILAAEGGTGKTAVLCGLALSVATGAPWLDVFDVEETGRTLLLLGEEDREECLRRLRAAAGPLGLDADEERMAGRSIMAVPLSGTPCALLEQDGDGNVRGTAFWEELLERAGEHEWACVILDPLSRFGGPETEVSAAAATRFVQTLEALTTLPGNPTVLVAHHTTKSGRADTKKGSRSEGTVAIRGAGALTDGVRWAATLADEDRNGMVTLRVVKSNYSERGAPVVLERRGGSLRNPEREESGR